MTTALLFIAISVFIFILFKKEQALKKSNADLKIFRAKYEGLINVDEQIERRVNDLKALNDSINALDAEYKSKNNQLGVDYHNKREIYDKLVSEISILEENLEDLSYGIYKPHFTYEHSDQFKQQLSRIVDQQKDLIRANKAAECTTTWTVEGSAEKGKKMVKESIKLMLRAFNGECDSAIAKVSWNNIANMEARIRKCYDDLNKLGSTNRIFITQKYLDLKLQELYLEFELEEKIYQEKEEQKRIKEEMREEEKALRELEKAKRDAEIEEERYEKALEKAKLELGKVQGEKLNQLNEKIRLLEESLQRAHEQKERAVSQAQLTKSGHVYIISNIGSFGEDIFKIGMTRRLEPKDRVKELGDASVPFDFDIHGLIFSENAPELENTLHKKLNDKRVNLVDVRAEFFKTSIDEVEKIINEMNLSVQLTKIAEAREYRETVSIREALDKTEHREVKVLEKFPSEL